MKELRRGEDPKKKEEKKKKSLFDLFNCVGCVMVYFNSGFFFLCSC
jgi:hypothetical protein